MLKKELWIKIRYPSIFFGAFIAIWTIFFDTYKDYISQTMNWSLEVIPLTFGLLDLISSIVICLTIAFFILIYYLIIFPNNDSEEFNIAMVEFIDYFREILESKGYISKKDLKTIKRRSSHPKILLTLLLKSFEANYIFIKIRGFHNETDYKFVSRN
ncbi:MAG: hypothetical protein ACTSR5_07685 [Promethearchaeota archaeon]